MHSWEVIAQMLSGRSAHAVRTHWYSMQLRKQHRERLAAQEKRDRHYVVDNTGNVTPTPSPPLTLGEVQPVATYEPDEPDEPSAKRVKTEATEADGGGIPPMPEDAFVKEESTDGDGIPPMPEGTFVKEEYVLDA